MKRASEEHLKTDEGHGRFGLKVLSPEGCQNRKVLAFAMFPEKIRAFPKSARVCCLEKKVKF